DLKDRPALIVGGGEAAARRLRLLRKAGARITVVAPRGGEEIAAAIDAGKIAAGRRGVLSGGRHRHALRVRAPRPPPGDDRGDAGARTAGIPVNVADHAGLSSFIVPAIVERDPVVIGISTGGAAPVLASRLREAIERLLPARLGRLAAFADSFRTAVKAT